MPNTTLGQGLWRINSAFAAVQQPLQVLFAGERQFGQRNLADSGDFLRNGQQVGRRVALRFLTERAVGFQHDMVDVQAACKTAHFFGGRLKQQVAQANQKAVANQPLRFFRAA